MILDLVDNIILFPNLPLSKNIIFIECHTMRYSVYYSKKSLNSIIHVLTRLGGHSKQPSGHYQYVKMGGGGEVG